MGIKLRRKAVKETEELFDSQIYSLAELDAPASIMTDPLISLMELKEKLISRVECFSLNGSLGDVWFLPVIPLNVINLTIQIQFLNFEGNKGYSYFKSKDICDLVNTSDKPYYIIGVNKNVNNVSVSRESFLTLAESLALCFFEKNLLQSFCVKPLNSGCLCGKPIIHIYQKEHPKVDWDYFLGDEDDCFSKIIKPYCLDRII